MKTWLMTVHTTRGEVEHLVGPFRRRAATAGNAIAAEMREGDWDADMISVVCEEVKEEEKPDA